MSATVLQPSNFAQSNYWLLAGTLVAAAITAVLFRRRAQRPTIPLEDQLMSAVQNGDLRTCCKILRNSQKSVPPALGEAVFARALKTAVVANSLAIVEAILKSLETAAGPILESRDAEGMSALLVAVLAGHDEVAVTLVRAGADVHQTGPKNRNAVFIACLRGAAPVARAMLAMGGTRFLEAAQARDVCGYNALHACGLAGSVEAAELVWTAGLKVDTPAHDGTTALHAAARSGHAAMLEWLLEHFYAGVCSGESGAGLPACRFGCTPLHVACTFAQPGAVRVLTRCVAIEQMVAQDNDGLHCLHSACQAMARADYSDEKQAAALQCFEALVEAGYPPCCVDYSDSSALYLLCWQPGPLQVKAATFLCQFLQRSPGRAAWLLRTPADSGWNCLQAAHNTRGPASAEMVAFLQTTAQAAAPDVLGCNLAAPRSTDNTRYLLRRGAHNRVPVEDRRQLLAGDHSLAGVAAFLQRLVDRGIDPRVVVLCGAGISTSCGIKDFRSSAGLYASKGTGDAFSAARFADDPSLFFRVLRQEFVPVLQAASPPRPSTAHALLRLLRDRGWLQRVYTQNIDMLETAAGLTADELVECHGSFRHIVCSQCDAPALDADGARAFWASVAGGEIPRCGVCTAPKRPAVVLFGEPLPERFSRLAREDVEQADLLLVMGTSLVVYPVAALPAWAPARCVRLLLNHEATGCFQGVQPCSDADAAPGAVSSEPRDGGDYRDVFFKGSCDQGAAGLIQALGWQPQYSALLSAPPWTPS